VARKATDNILREFQDDRERVTTVKLLDRAVKRMCQASGEHEGSRGLWQ
jgi:hypothetical protein